MDDRPAHPELELCRGCHFTHADGPDAQRMLARGQVQRHLACGVGLAVIRGVDHVDIADHGVVDVATQRGGAWLVKDDGFGRHARVELDLEFLGA